MRKSDALTIKKGTPGRELMMRAALGVFNCVKKCHGAWEAPVAILCGSGNNAGDGYALALCLREEAIDCTVFCVYDRFSEDGRYYYDKCKEAGIDIVSLADGKASIDLGGYNTTVDCLLGTGFKGKVRDELCEVIEAVNESDTYVVSVDINSGLNGDTGMADICIRSDLTVSVGGFKPGHFLNMAKDVMKEKINTDIGIKPADETYRLIDHEDIKKVLGERLNFSNKGTYGYTALIGGSTRYSGAIRLAYLANAAARSGAGVVKVALPAALAHDVTPHILESTIFPLSYIDVMSTKPDEQHTVTTVSEEAGSYEVACDTKQIDELISNVKTVAFGMGIGTGRGALGILEHLLSDFSGTLVIDADGLTLLAGMDKSKIENAACSLILTPHIREFSRLTGLDKEAILEDPIGTARAFAQKVGATVLLKGPSTIVTDGDKVYIIDRGCAGMATAGSGDVLSGILAAVCGYGHADMCLNTAVAAYINGAAGELAEKRVGPVSMIASDTVAAIADVIFVKEPSP